MLVEMLLVFAGSGLWIPCSLWPGVWHATTCEVCDYLGRNCTRRHCTSVRLSFIGTVIVVRLKIGTYVQSQLVMHIVRSVVVLAMVWMIARSCYCCCDLATFSTVNVGAWND